MAKIDLPSLHPGQEKVFKSKARFKVLACGRRWGKSFLCALMCIFRANEKQACYWVAPTLEQGNIGWNMLMSIVAQFPKDYVKIRETPKRVEFASGGWIQIRSADKPDNLRGVSLDFVVLDECAWIDRRTWFEVLRPALADRQGHAVFISTPKGIDWFHELYQAGMTGLSEEIQSFKFPTSSNPYIPAGEIEAAKKAMDSRTFRQEFLAEFLEDAGGVFRKVRTAATADITNKAVKGDDDQQHMYIVGVDWGRKHDYTAFAVLDCNTKQIVWVERFSGVEYATQKQRLKSLNERFHPAVIWAENNAMGDPVIEELANEDLPIVGFSTQVRSKMEIMDSLALGLDNEILKLPDAEKMMDDLPAQAIIGELQAYEGKRTKTGLMSYGAPEGYHDDMVMAIALAWHHGKDIEPESFKVRRRAPIL